jgi:hypothetical protein
MTCIGVLAAGRLGYLPPRKWDTKKLLVESIDKNV